MRQLEVRLLGRFEVLVDSQPVPADAWAQRRAADLVKLLALAPGHRMPRDEVLEMLWPQLGADAAASNLHKAASYARRALGDRGAVVLRGGSGRARAGRRGDDRRRALRGAATIPPTAASCCPTSPTRSGCSARARGCASAASR